MASVIPFKGVLYNPDKVSGDEVLAPPYDIISPELRELLYQNSPYNIVRIDFGKKMPDDTAVNNRYTRARDYLEQWIQDGILFTDERPSFYAYEIEYEIFGEHKKLRGLLSLVKLEELGNGIYPHEATYSKPKADRLSLMKTCLANVSPIYSLYNSSEKITSQILTSIHGKPFFSGRDAGGAFHKLYRISDPQHIESVANDLADKSIYIADGHHRYEVALEFKKMMDGDRGQPAIEEKIGVQLEHRSSSSTPKPWDYVMMFLANMAEDGIAILPTHRLVKGPSQKNDILDKLRPAFIVRKLDMDGDITKVMLKEGKNTLGLYLSGEKAGYLLKYRGNELSDVHPALRDLDVVILQELILKRDLGIDDIAYEMDIEAAINRVRAGEFSAAFFLNATTVEDVEKVALANLRMPPKSTYFYPKLLTGMVINRFRNF
ncbi:MAG: DUF1015 domain-containing protein [Dissulfurispiraceae bacterium]